VIEKGVLTVTTVTLAPFSASPAGVTAPSGYLATMTETTSTNCTYTSDCVQTFQIQIKNLNDNCTMSGNFISNFDRFNGTIGAIDVIDAYSLSMIVQFFSICTNNIATSQPTLQTEILNGIIPHSLYLFKDKAYNSLLPLPVRSPPSPLTSSIYMRKI